MTPIKFFLIAAWIALFCLLGTTPGNAQCSGVDSISVSSPVCVNQSITFTNNSTGGANSYDFNFGDGSRNNGVHGLGAQTHTYTSAGTYTAYVVRHFTGGLPCSDSVAITVVVNPTTRPTAAFNFTPTSAVCTGSNVTLTNTSSGHSLTYLWLFGDGDSSIVKNPVHAYESFGTGNQNFGVTLIATDYNGCSADTLTDSVTVKQVPEPILDDTLNSFSAFRKCSSTLSNDSFEIAVENQTIGGAAISSYSIDWGDGSAHFSGTSSFAGTTHTYTSLGVFTLKFTATDTNGCSATTDYTVINESNPSVGVVSPGSTTGCEPQSFWFKLNATNVSPTTSFIWSFGDGSTTTWDYTKAQDSILHTFTKTSCGNTPPGGGCSNCYVVAVSAANSCDTTTASVNGIKIYGKPKANFTASTTVGCANSSTITFTNTSVPNCISNNTYKWSFGDGATSTATSPTHKYTNQGNYSIRLIATNPCGADTIIKTIEIDSVPVPNFTFPGGSFCATAVVNFTNTSAGKNLVYQWTLSPASGWSFTNGTSSSSQSPQVTFTSAGTYTVSMKASNSCGSVTKSQTIVIATKPLVTLGTIANHCGPYTISPSATFNNEGNAITTYAWSFTGGSPSSSSLQNPGSVTYTSAGSYTLTVSATNACGTSSATQSFTVHPLPNALNAGNQTICVGTTVSLGSSPAVSGDTYSWTSNPSGFTSTSSNPSVMPSATTSYFLTETITATGCSKTDTVTITVNPLPTVSAGSNQTLCISVAAFSLTGFSPSGGTWSGTGVSSAGVFNPATAGVGTVTLTYTYTDPSTHCTNTATKTIKVNPLPVVSAGLNDTFCNTPGTITLTGFSPSSGGTWSGTGVSSSGVFTPSTAGTGSDTLTYSFTNANGCTNTAQIVVLVKSPPTVVAGNNDTVCISAGNYTLTGFSPAGGAWSGTGVSNTGVFSPSSAGVGTYTLTYTYGSGTCQISATKIVKVNPLPTVSAGSNQTLCISVAPFTLTGFSPTGGTWSGTGVSSAGVFNPSTAGVGTVTLTYTYTDPTTHCVNTSTKTVKVNPLPVVSAGLNDTFCNTPGTITLTGFSPSSGGTWTGTGVSSSGVFTPSTAGNGSDTLTYSFKNTNGCTNTSKIEVLVTSPATVVPGSNDTVCVSAGNFTLTGFSPAGGTWSGTGVSSAGVFSPATAGAGVFTLTYTYGVSTCKVSGSKIVKVNALPTVSAGSNEATCLNTVPYSLSGFSPTGGTWSGTGVSSAGVFNPSTAGVGTVTLTYTYTDPTTHCTNSNTKTIKVNPLPVVSAGLNDTFCNTPGTITLTGFSPSSGGTWSGTGVSSSGVFTPSTAGNGSDTLTYSFTNGNGCTNTSKIEVLVTSPATVVPGSNDTVCISAGNFTLTGFSPAGGTWSGTGVSSAGVFSPGTAGAGVFTLTYTYGVSTCKVSGSKIVKVNALPTVSAGSNETTCLNTVPYSLSGFSPTGGTWSGTGVSSAGVFNPSAAGVGTVTLTYTYTDPITHCVNTSTKTVKVNPLPVVSAGLNDTFCNTPGTITLTGFSPSSGGTWTGTGVSSSGVFTPSTAGTGSDTLTYSFTNGNGCTNTSKIEVLVTSPATVVPGSNDTVCVSAGNFSLAGFSPAGGVWSGTGVSSAGVFSPATAGAGVFTLTYTYGVSTCKVSGSKVVKVNALPTVSAGSNETTCLNTIPYSLSGFSPTGGTWSGTGVSSAGVFNPSTAGVGTVTLTYTYTDPTTHCVNTSTKTVKVNALPVVSAGLNDTFCNTPGTVTLTGFSPSSGGTWTGTGVSSSGVFTPSTAGTGSDTLTYSFTNGNGCTNTSKIEVLVTSPATVVPGSNDTVCVSAGNYTLTGFSPAGGTWSGTGVSSAGVFSPATAGAGVFTLTYTYGVSTCKVSGSKIVKVNDLPTVSAGSNESTCLNTVPYSLSGFSPAGGVWSGTGVSNAGVFNPATAGATTVTLTYTYTDPTTHCTNSNTKTIKVNPLPVVSAGLNDTFCNTPGTITLTGFSPSSGGTWSGTGVSSTGVFTPSSAGNGSDTLTYSFTNGNGCTNTSKIEVLVTSPATVVPGSNDTVCISAGNFTLTGFSPAGGTWSGTGVSSAGVFSPATAGAGVFTLTYTYGVSTCKVSGSKIVKVNALPTVSAGSNEATCLNTVPYSLSGFSPTGGTWSGTGVSSAGVFNPATAGATTVTLTYTYTDPTTHCTNSNTKTVKVNPLPVVSAGLNDTFCNTPGTVTLTGFSPSTGGTWSGKGVSNTGVFTPSTAGNGSDTLTYSFTNSNGCTNTSQIEVLVTSPATVVPGSNDTVCVSAGNYTLTGFSPAGGTWSGTGVSSAGVFSPATAGAGVFTLTYTYGVSTCKVSGSKIVKVNALPTVSAGSNESTCLNTTPYSLSGFSPTGGTWSGTGVSSAGVFNPATAGATTVTLTYTYTDPTTHCTNSNTKTIKVNPLPVVSAGLNDTFCNTPGTITLTGFSPSSGGSWTGTGVSSSGVFTPSTAGTGSDTLTYSFTNGNGCTNTSQIEVLVTSPATIVPGSNDTVCISAGNFTLTGFSPAGGTWSGTGVSSSGVFSPATAGVGVYTLTYTYGTGTCKVSNSRVVKVNPLPTVSAGNNETVCLNTTPYGLSSFSPTGGTWSGSGVSSSGTFNPSTAGVGTVTLTYTYTDPTTHCTNTATKSIKINALPVVSAGLNDTFCNTPGTVTLTGFSPSTGGTWSGKGVSNTGVFTPSTAGNGSDTLTYSFTNSNGCTNTSQIEVLVTSPATIVTGSNDTVCISAGNYTLSGFSPTGGIWSGTGISGAGVFSPGSAGAGTYTLTYTYGAGTCKVSGSKIVKVNPLPIVNAGSNEVVCISMAPYALSGNSPTGGTWSGVGVSSSGIFSPATSGAGTITLTYTYTDPTTHCVNTSTKTIKVNPLPTVTAGAADTFCNTSITATLVGSPTGGVWHGKGVSTSGVFTPSSAGVGVLNLYYIYSDPSTGCTDSAQQIVNVVNPANVIAGQNDTVCIDAADYLLKNFSPSGGFWTGTDVTSSGTFSPGTAGAGVFTLTYTVGKNTCKVSDSKIVKVNPLPIVTAGSNRAACLNAPDITLAGYSPTGGTWTGNGIVSGSSGIFSPLKAGVGSSLLTYTYTDPKTHCTSSDTVRITVLPLPNVAMTNDSFGCRYSPASFSSTSNNTVKYNWSFGDSMTDTGAKVHHAFNYIGFHTVTLISFTKDGCSDTFSSRIRIAQPPLANFTRTPYSGPGPLTVSFTDLSQGEINSYAWNFGDKNTASTRNVSDEIYQQSDNGDTTYYITLTVNNKCGTSVHTDSALVFPRPKARFGTDKDAGCSPFKVLLSDKSVGKPTSYYWNFGNGDTSTQKNPPYETFRTDSVVKTYTIYEVAINKYGRDTFRHTITVYPNTVRAFFNANITSGCEPLTVQFTDFSRGGTFNSWDFGDSNVSALQNPIHTYNKPGLFIAKEFVNDGCSYDTTSVLITVHPKPPVSWTAAPTCAGDSMQFTNLSSNFSGASWDFGDGGHSQLVSPRHAFTKPGKYLVTLTIQSLTYGCPSSFTDTATVDSVPAANFSATPMQGCHPLDVQFVSIGNSPVFYKWDFGDGNTGIGANITHIYPDSGTYTVKYSIVTRFGCTNQAEKKIIVFPYPLAAFSIIPNPVCGNPKTIRFKNASKGASAYFWRFSNGKTSIDDTAQVVFDSAGTYTAQLIAFNSFGCKDSISHSFTIYPQPVAAFGVGESGCQSKSVQFANNSTFTDSFYWDFGDGTTDSIDKNPVHTYNAPGSYTVSLRVTGKGGCEDQIVKPNAIVVHPKPKAGFYFVVQENPTTGWVNFYADTAQVTGFAWDFGDHDTDNTASPKHRYDLPGIYTVRLVVENAFGCYDTITQEVTIDYFDGLYIPNALAPSSGPPEERVFLPKGASLQSYHLQIYTTWGELLWESYDLINGHPATGWDGTSNGKPMPEGVYVWKISATFINGKVWQGKDYGNATKPIGSVTLVR